MRRSLSLKGFTFIEIVVAMLILTIAATGIFASFVSSKKYFQTAHHRIFAMNLARQTLEDLRLEVRADTWDNGFLGDGFSTQDDIIGPVNIRFQRYYNVSFVDLNGNGTEDAGEPHKVTLTISWDEL